MVNFISLLPLLALFPNTSNAASESFESKLEWIQEMMVQKEAALLEASEQYIYTPDRSSSDGSCVGGLSLNMYPCNQVDLLATFTYSDMEATFKDPGTNAGNDIWGWTDPTTGKEYAIVNLMDGTAIVDVTDVNNLVNMAFIPITTKTTPIYQWDGEFHYDNVTAEEFERRKERIIWHDVKVYNDHAFIVSEQPEHGMQVFNLDRIRNGPIGRVQPDVIYRGVGSVHNIAINEESGFAYMVASRTCRYGLHIVDIRNPLKPTFSNCFDEDGYTHDVQCVIYDGPDAAYQGREICFAYNGDTLTIVDVTDKENLEMISRTVYEGSAFTHQGWLSDDGKFLLLNDEQDESKRLKNGEDAAQITYVWDVEFLDSPEMIQQYNSTIDVIDHNLYIKGNYSYQANYDAGLRVVDMAPIYEGEPMREVAFFDFTPSGNRVSFTGAWSTYIGFGPHKILVNTMTNGLYVLKVNLPKQPEKDARDIVNTSDDKATSHNDYQALISGSLVFIGVGVVAAAFLMYRKRQARNADPFAEFAVSTKHQV